MHVSVRKPSVSLSRLNIVMSQCIFGIAAFNFSQSSVVGRVIAIYTVTTYANWSQILWEQTVIK